LASASNTLATPPNSQADKTKHAQPLSQRASSRARILRLTQLYRALIEINQAIIRMHAADELFPLVCRTAVNFGGVSMAWIGIADPDSELIVPAASYGIGTEYLQTIQVSTLPDQPQDQGPSTRAYYSNHFVIINDWAREPMAAMQQEQAKSFHWGSRGSFPILKNQKPYAVLSVYHKEKHFFDAETTELLDEMSRDISFALDNFEREQERLSALSALSVNEQRFRAYFERSIFGMGAICADGSWLEVNPALCEMFGYTPDEFTNLNWTKLTHPDDLETGKKLFRQLLDGTLDDFVIEKRHIRKSGDIMDALLAALP